MADFSVGMVIDSYETLEKLPVGSAVVDSEGWVYQSDYCAPFVAGVKREMEWGSAANWWKTEQIELPVTLIHLSAWKYNTQVDEEE